MSGVGSARARRGCFSDPHLHCCSHQRLGNTCRPTLIPGTRWGFPGPHKCARTLCCTGSCPRPSRAPPTHSAARLHLALPWIWFQGMRDIKHLGLHTTDREKVLVSEAGRSRRPQDGERRRRLREGPQPRPSRSQTFKAGVQAAPPHWGAGRGGSPMSLHVFHMLKQNSMQSDPLVPRKALPSNSQHLRSM